MGSAFVAIVPTRPCPLFGRPVHRRGSPHRLRPGASPHALRIPPHGGHPALLSLDGRGQRGITPTFGYGAPHPSASGTSTHLSTLLPSAHYGRLCRDLRGLLLDSSVWGLEIFYNIAATHWLFVTPDIQVIEPAAKPASTAFLTGLRVQMRF